MATRDNSIPDRDHSIAEMGRMIVNTSNARFAGSLIAARTEDSSPVALRMAKYPDGREAVQGAYRWTEGFSGGVAWRDLHVVLVDKEGKEIE